MRLPVLWNFSLVLVAFLALVLFFFCPNNALNITSELVIQPPPARTEELRPKPAQSYTFIGSSDVSVQNTEDPIEKSDRDTTLSQHRREQIKTTHGEIPDLDIRLNGIDIRKIISHYGYVPAVKSKKRLLGKIVGGKFQPIAKAELARYARRGRSGLDYPQAEQWLQRVSREFSIPRHELNLIFLVPHRTEQFFVDAQMSAIAQAQKSVSGSGVGTCTF